MKKADGAWTVVDNSPYNRRITLETEMAIGGPCASHDGMKTSYDPDGLKARGTNYNCGGGITHWGTVLTC